MKLRQLFDFIVENSHDVERFDLNYTCKLNSLIATINELEDASIYKDANIKKLEDTYYIDIEDKETYERSYIAYTFLDDNHNNIRVIYIYDASRKKHIK